MKSKYSRITLGGLAGTGKGTISTMLAEKLELQRVSTGDFFRDVAKEKGLSLVELDKQSLTDNSVDILTDNRTKDFAEKKNNFILDSRLAAHFVKDAYKILLLCDDRRYERIAGRDQIPVEEAKKETLEREATYHKRYGELYNLADFDDPKYYDLVIDTSDLTPEQIVEKIISQIT